MRIKHLFILTLVVLFSPVVHAQGIWSGGSAYSSVGYGMPNDFRAEFANAMGVYGVATMDYRHSNTANPALWGFSRFTNISGGFMVNNFETSEGDDRTWNNVLAPTQFQFVLPILRDQLGVSASLIPLTRAGFDLKGANQTLEDGTVYSITQRGSGNLNAFEIGFGWRINSNIAVGFAPSFVFGSYTRTSEINFESNDYLSDSFDTNTFHSGFRNRAGVHISLPGFHGSASAFSIGLAATLPVNLDVDRERKTQVGTREIVINPSDEFDLEGRIPAEVAFGVAYDLSAIWGFSADVLYQNWSDAVTVDQHSLYDITDRIRVGAGFRANASRTFSEPYAFNRFNYRLGASYDTGYLSVNDSQIHTLMLHGGLGIPSRRSGSSVNVNFEFGFRGNELDTTITERIYGVSITFSLSELMFYRARLQ